MPAAVVVVLSAVAVGAAAVAPSPLPAGPGASVSVCGGERARGGGGHNVSGRRTLPSAVNGRVVVVDDGGDGNSPPAPTPSCRGEREQEREGGMRARGEIWGADATTPL